MPLAILLSPIQAPSRNTFRATEQQHVDDAVAGIKRSGVVRSV